LGARLAAARELPVLSAVGDLSEAVAVSGFVLVGSPRTELQLAELDVLLERIRVRLDAVVWILTDPAELERRLVEQARVEGRAETAEAIRARHEEFLEQAAPLMGEYRYRGLLIKVDGNGTAVEVEQRIAEALGSMPAQR
jgi:adenylate kinase